MTAAQASLGAYDCLLCARGGGHIVTAPYAWALLLAALALAIDAAAASSPTSEWERRVPSPSLDPAAVIRIQVEALRANGLLNEGIKLTYSFASPENRRSTGPLGRFSI
jgi:hypothetical protein